MVLSTSQTENFSLLSTLSPSGEIELGDIFMTENPDRGVCIVLCVEILGCCAMELLRMLHMFIVRVVVVDIIVTDGAKEMKLRVVMLLLFMWIISLELRLCMIYRVS